MTRKQALLSLVTICSAPMGLVFAQKSEKPKKSPIPEPLGPGPDTVITVPYSDISIANRYDPAFTMCFKDQKQFKISLHSKDHSMLVEWNENNVSIKLDELMEALKDA